MEILTYTRACAYALNTMCQQLGLANLAVGFDGDNLNDWAVLIPEVRILKNGRSVGSIEVTDSLSSGLPALDLYIVVGDVYNLIRDKHVSEFEPQEYGLVVNTARDWTGAKQPDLVVEWTVGMDEIRQGPARPYARQTGNWQHIQVIPSI